jgi:hypothetical protein
MTFPDRQPREQAVFVDLFAARATRVRRQPIPHWLEDGMGGGIKRNKSSLPKGRSGMYGGLEPQPGDEQVGGWSRQQREEMDQRFTDAMARALRSGQEGPPPANATVSSRGHARTPS